MRTLSGIPLNVNREIMGKITRKGRRIWARKHYIYVSTNQDKVASGYLAVLTDQSFSKTQQSTVVNIAKISELNEGDVVLISPNGTVSVLYEANSEHNAIMVTERCNHRCVMCPQPPISSETDKTEFNLKLLSFFDSKTKDIGITGGEPTLIGDNLFILLEYIKKKLPKSAVSILSNGVKFADYQYASRLTSIKNHDLQIDIPLFSDLDTEHNRIVGADTFYKTIKGLYNLALLRQKIGLRVVIHRQTYRRLPQLAEFIYRNFPFVFQVAFMQMEVTGYAEKNINDLWIDPYDYRQELEKAVLHLAHRRINVSIYNMQLCLLPDNIKDYARQSISDWKNVYLEECKNCESKNQCAGFFATSPNNLHSQHIKPVTKGG